MEGAGWQLINNVVPGYYETHSASPWLRYGSASESAAAATPGAGWHGLLGPRPCLNRLRCPPGFGPSRGPPGVFVSSDLTIWASCCPAWRLRVGLHPGPPGLSQVPSPAPPIPEPSFHPPNDELPGDRAVGSPIATQGVLGLTIHHGGSAPWTTHGCALPTVRARRVVKFKC